MIYLAVLIEGYIVLATELIAIRLLVPFVGSGTEIVAIIVGAVLLPLAAGYEAGSRHPANKPVRKRLLRNALSALGILAFGLSYPFLQIFFSLTDALHVHRLAQTTLYVALFLIYPVYLLAQTVPLVSHYFRGASLSRHTGRMLFFSTLGSFLGSILSTLVLMTVIGVHGTVIVTMGLLLTLIVLLAHRRYWYDVLIGVFLFLVVCGMNNAGLFSKLHIVSNNAYNIIRVYDVPHEPGNRILDVNHSYSSKFAQEPQQDFPYLRFIRQHFIEPLAASTPPRAILILGAGGFTLGRHDSTNQYDYVDIDPAIKDVSERAFLKKPLAANQHFHPASARAFLRESDATYDLIVIDVYSDMHSIPAETTTVEFFEGVKAHLKPGGIVVANVIASPAFADRFTRRYTNSFMKVFPHYSRQIIGDFNAWGGKQSQNIIYIHFGSSADDTRYTDDKNTYFLDRD